MARVVFYDSPEETVIESRPISNARQLRRIAEEKARLLEAEYQAKIANGDYSDESFREYAQKLNDVLRDYGNQLIESYGST